MDYLVAAIVRGECIAGLAAPRRGCGGHSLPHDEQPVERQAAGRGNVRETGSERT